VKTNQEPSPSRAAFLFLILLACLFLPACLLAHEPGFTDEFGRARCTFATSGSNPYLPLWVGQKLVLEGEEEDDGETVEIRIEITTLADTELVDGVITRVVEEREEEDGELKEISRNFMAYCQETGDVYYFGEDVDDYEDGQVVGHGGSWRAGQNGARPGLLMPGTPLLGARYYQENAPPQAVDQGEVTALGLTVTVPAGTYTGVLEVMDNGVEQKLYAPGVGPLGEGSVKLVEVVPAPCRPGPTQLCLANGRFKVAATWRDFLGQTGTAKAVAGSDGSGAFWFFSVDNTELTVKVLDGCATNGHFWVFGAGLTDVEVSLTITDTGSGLAKTYPNSLGHAFAPILDIAAFATCN
jgi:hypothetical protein